MLGTRRRHAASVAPAGAGHEVVALAHADLDITDRRRGRTPTLRRARPDAVVNCAAWTDVDGAEDERGRARCRSTTRARACSPRAAAAVGAKVVYPSSDYVFDGTKGGPYVESDMPRRSRPTAAPSRRARPRSPCPTRATSSSAPRGCSASAGRNFVETMLRIGDEQPEVLVVSDQVGCPTYTRHLARRWSRLIEGDDYGIHHIAGGGPVLLVRVRAGDLRPGRGRLPG